MLTIRLLRCGLLGILTFGASGGWPKDKSSTNKPPIERFEASTSKKPVTDQKVSIIVLDDTPDEDIAKLGEVYRKGGLQSLDRAMGKINKGSMSIGGGAMPLEIAYSHSAGGRTKLTFIAERGQYMYSLQVSGSFNDYPYTCVILEFDEHGKGKGVLLPYMRVRFNDEGRMVIENSLAKSPDLVNVHAVK
jgi:hypothetical protein